MRPETDLFWASAPDAFELLKQAGEETTDILINKAETALYHAKRSGRGKVVVYTREMEEAAKRVTRIEQALRRAVSAGEVEPHFQPIVDLGTRRTIGFEALARWSDPGERCNGHEGHGQNHRYTVGDRHRQHV